MGVRVLEFTRKHVVSSPALASAVARLKELLDRADRLSHQQLDGRNEVHAATARKAELRRLIRGRHLQHLKRVAEVASVEEPELEQKFVIPRDTHTYRGFHTAATGMVAEAASRKELLLKHGLDEEVLTGLQVALDQFETAVEQGAAGRLAHVGATAELNQIAEDVVQVVGVMTTIIHVRFANQPELIAAWDSASNVVAAPRPENKPATGGTSTGGIPPTSDVSPAA